jgi:membrane fusion protein, multidrug efflux system
MGEYFVYIAKDTVYDSQGQDAAAPKSTDTAQGPKLRAFEVKVQLGQTIGANVIVRSGIDEGDKIIVDGVQAIHEGSEITTSSKSPPGKKENAGN